MAFGLLDDGKIVKINISTVKDKHDTYVFSCYNKIGRVIIEGYAQTLEEAFERAYQKCLIFR